MKEKKQSDEEFIAKIATLNFNIKTSPKQVKEAEIEKHHHTHGPTCGCGVKCEPVKAFDIGNGHKLVKYVHPKRDKDESAFAA